MRTQNHHKKEKACAAQRNWERLSRISGMEWWWNGIPEWNTDMTFDLITIKMMRS